MSENKKNNRKIKNDTSDTFIFDSNYTGKLNFYACQIKYNDGKFNLEWDVEEKGYYLLITAVDFNVETKEISNPNLTYSDIRLLVSCNRRGEQNFNIAKEAMEKVAKESIATMEADRRWLEDRGCKDEDDIDKFLEGLLGDLLKEEEFEKPVEKPKKAKVELAKRGFNRVAGMEEVKEVFRDVIDQFKNPKKYKHFDINPMRAILLHGAPGTGKTFVAEAFAEEIDAEFKKVSMGELGSKYQNQTSNNIKDLFEKARKREGITVLFFDEVDSIASKRGMDENSKEKNTTLNTLLQEMGSSENEKIFIICATNFYENLDEAFKRKGRIDVELEIPLPDFETRKGILELNTRKKPLGEDVDLEKIARNMSGMNCADCDVLVNESARLALKRDKEAIEQIDFEDAMEEMITGKKSKTKRLDEKTKRIVATHEVGHLLMNELLEVNKTKKVSIMPKGSTLGYLMHMNEDNEDVFLHNEEELKNRLLVMLGGRANEEIFLGNATTGASDDLQKANNLLRRMITQFGYCDELKLLVIDENDIFMREKVNDLMMEKLDRLYRETKKILEENKDLSEALINELLIKEELDGKEVEKIINNYKKEQVNN